MITAIVCGVGVCVSALGILRVLLRHRRADQLLHIRFALCTRDDGTCDFESARHCLDCYKEELS